jgi:hypothetical protein
MIFEEICLLMKLYCILIFYTTATDISVLGLLYCAVLGHVADVSQVLPASICRLEDRGSMHLLNVGNIVHNYVVKQHRTRININI